MQILEDEFDNAGIVKKYVRFNLNVKIFSTVRLKR